MTTCDFDLLAKIYKAKINVEGRCERGDSKVPDCRTQPNVISDFRPKLFLLHPNNYKVYSVHWCFMGNNNGSGTGIQEDLSTINWQREGKHKMKMAKIYNAKIRKDRQRYKNIGKDLKR